MPKATDMLQQLQASSLPDEMKARIVETIQAKVSSPDDMTPPEKCKRKSAETQRCRYMYNFFTARDWETFLGTASLDLKMHTCARRLSLLGLTNPTEPTSVMGLAILLLSSHKGSAADLTLQPGQTMNKLDDLKAAIKRCAKRSAHSGLAIYPETPQQLEESLFRKAYREAEPVPCKLQVEDVVMLADTLPARKSHGSVNMARGRRDGPFKQDLPLQNLLAMGSMLLQQQQMAMNSCGQSGCDFTYLQPRKKPKLHLEDAEGRQSPAKLALPPPQEGSAKGLAEAEAVDEAKPSLPASGSKAAVQQLALPPQEDLDIDGMAAEVQQHLADKKAGAVKRKDLQAGEKEPTAKAKAKAKAKASASSKSKVDVAKTLPTKGTTSPKQPVLVGCVKVFTCCNSSNWRVKVVGETKDRAFSWKVDKDAAWKRLLEYVAEKNK